MAIFFTSIAETFIQSEINNGGAECHIPPRRLVAQGPTSVYLFKTCFNQWQ
jgi:hypothetical protein